MTPAGQPGSGAAGRDRPGGARSSALLNARPAAPLRCNRCGFPVSSRAMGCKNPCANCGTVYPLGDCSD